jgi:hypothetical protein
MRIADCYLVSKLFGVCRAQNSCQDLATVSQPSRLRIPQNYEFQTLGRHSIQLIGFNIHQVAFKHERADTPTSFRFLLGLATELSSEKIYSGIDSEWLPLCRARKSSF